MDEGSNSNKTFVAGVIVGIIMGAFLFMRFIWKRQVEDVQILNSSNEDSITDYRRLSATP